jgi:DNA polymerase (family 10)
MHQLTKDEIADLLESMGQLLELKGENPFKTRAYTNAARVVQTFSGDLAQMARDNRLEEIAGIGKAIAEKIGGLVLRGDRDFYDNLKAEFPAGIFDLFSLQGLGAKRIKTLHEKLQISSVTELEAACRDGRVAKLDGFGTKTAAKICEAIARREQTAGSFRLGDVAFEAEQMLADLRAHDAVIQVSVAGSYRRRKEVVHDLDFVVSTSDPADVTEFFVAHSLVADVLARGTTKTSVRFRSGIQGDLRVVRDVEFAFALNYFTGSKEHNVAMRSRALKRNWTLNEYRIEALQSESPQAKKKARPVPEIRDERGLYRALDLSFVEPELRENCGEFDAAEKDELPELVALENLRGTFHCHTTASDGRSSLEEMAQAAQDLGLQYLGIADHSRSSIQAHGLEVKRLLDQIKSIATLNETFDGFRIFTGVECDILKDGSLDFPDEILSQLDYVVASVHASFNLPEAQMTRRIIAAISNPNVTFLGHLTGRLLLAREGYSVDVPAVIDAAAATKTIIELNANPRRLDMDWRWWPLAKKKGVKCVINPDAHHTSSLQNLWFGIGAARKGWLMRHDVINCLPLGKIETQLAAKRKRVKS